MTKRAVIRTIYDHPSDMERILPGGDDIKSSSRTLAVMRGAKRFCVLLHPPPPERWWPIWFARLGNCFSNFIKGHLRGDSPETTRLVVGDLNVVLDEGSFAWLQPIHGCLPFRQSTCTNSLNQPRWVHNVGSRQ